MTSRHSTVLAATSRILVVIVTCGFALFWLSGGLEPKIEDAEGRVASPSPRQLPAGAATVRARRVEVPVVETATGTVEAVHEIALASRILATVLEINAVAGQRVAAGDVVARLDDRDLQARRGQAEAALAAAESRLAKAKLDEERARTLRADGVISQEELDRATMALETARAELDRAHQALDEAKTVLDWTEIRAPVDGIVVEKYVEVGDTVRPGQVIATLYDPTRMQLVARVREALAQELVVGGEVAVTLDALGKTCSGSVSEVVPSSDPKSRTFTVKVTGPCPPGVFSGMFGRIEVPRGVRTPVVIPQSALVRIGQIHLVDVVADGRLERRAVRLGEEFDDDVEVLAGVREGEILVDRPER